MRLQIDLFGPVRAHRGHDTVALGSPHRRALLAILALHANRVITRSMLADALWGDDPPPSVASSIYTYVSSLRAALEPGRVRGTHSRTLASMGGGYCLQMPTETIDVLRFEELRREARLRRDAGDPVASLTALDEALGLYRCEPLDGLPGPFASTQRERLRELRLDVAEQRASLLLDTGRHADVVADLVDVAHDHPHRERLQILLLVALYRCGRRGDALRAFHHIRAVANEQLGTDPGLELTGCYEHIAADDGVLLAPARPPSPIVHRNRPRGHRAAAFVGRQGDLTALREALAAVAAGRGGSLWFDGEPGIGKSALLAEVVEGRMGVRVGSGRADELSADSPLRLMLDSLSGALASDDPCRTELAELTELAAIAAADAQPGARLVSLVDRLVALVEQACRNRPLALVIDDMQWADRLSLLLWARLAETTRRLPLLVVGAGRPVPLRPEVVGLRVELAAGGTMMRRLGPLSEQELRCMVGRGWRALPAGLARAAAGNPGYAADLIAGWTREIDDGHVPSTGPGIPTAAVPMVVKRLNFLSSTAFDVLQRMALFDGPVTRDDVAEAAGDLTANIDDALTEACAAGLLELQGDRFGFHHPVVRGALSAWTPAAIRFALRRRARPVGQAARTPVPAGDRSLRDAGPDGRPGPAPPREAQPPPTKWAALYSARPANTGPPFWCTTVIRPQVARADVCATGPPGGSGPAVATPRFARGQDGRCGYGNVPRTRGRIAPGHG